MPTLELAAGQVVTAAHTNTYWMRQVIATGLSTARPTPYAGRAVYDTDTHTLNIYTTATTGWQPPWNLPWGYIASCEIASDTTQSDTNVNLCSMDVAVAKGRRYRIHGMARVASVPGVTPNSGTVHWSPAFTVGSTLLTPSGRSPMLIGIGAQFDPWPDKDVVALFDLIYEATGTGTVRVHGNAWSASVVAKWYAGGWVDIDDIGPATTPP